MLQAIKIHVKFMFMTKVLFAARTETIPSNILFDYFLLFLIVLNGLIYSLLAVNILDLIMPGFSDYDLVIQINCRSISYLNCIYIHLINRLCYALFPFQHHSSFFIFNFFDNLSCSPHLPISAFDDVVALTNHSNFPLRLFNPFGLSYSGNRFTTTLSRIKILFRTTVLSCRPIFYKIY